MLQIGIAVARICRAVGGPDLGQPDLDGPLREYKKPEQPVNAREQGKQATTKAADAAKASTELKPASQSKAESKKQKHATNAGPADVSEGKAGKKGASVAKKAKVEAIQEPEIVIVDELQENAHQSAEPKKKKVPRKNKKSKGS